MALHATHDAFVSLAIDGQIKKIAQTANLWSLMRGNAADTDTPTVTLSFDYVWQVGHAWTEEVVQRLSETGCGVARTALYLLGPW